MLFDQDTMKTVTFLGYRNSNGELRWGGTAFVVHVPLTETIGERYLITARHCVEGIREVSEDGKILVRVNLVGGSCTILEVGDWSFHPSSSSYVDVAVAPFAAPSNAEILAIPPHNVMTPELMLSKQIGAGDDVFIVGLFKKNPGESRAIPIGRIGTIAAIPQEPIWTMNYGDMEAILIECRSMGGLSGSPVFVNLDPYLDFPPNSLLKTSSTGGRSYSASRLLGLVHGHWEDDASDDFRDSRMNVGIAIVVPAHKVLEALNTPALVTHREQLKSSLR